jgi:hypothetical protein
VSAYGGRICCQVVQLVALSVIRCVVRTLSVGAATVRLLTWFDQTKSGGEAGGLGAGWRAGEMSGEGKDDSRERARGREWEHIL